MPRTMTKSPANILKNESTVIIRDAQRTLTQLRIVNVTGSESSEKVHVECSNTKYTT